MCRTSLFRRVGQSAHMRIICPTTVGFSATVRHKRRVRSACATMRNSIAVERNTVPELGRADAHRVFQYRLEHGLQLPGELEMMRSTRPSPPAAPALRLARGCALRVSSPTLLGVRDMRSTCFLAFVVFERRLVMGVRALCLFARQGHLVGTSLVALAVGQDRAVNPNRTADELAPHSITSSAMASSDGGTSRPSALAVLRLMTSSYLVGACTGRSAGFSPLRMRST